MVELRTFLLTFFLGLSSIGMAYLMIALTMLAIRIRRQDRELLSSIRSNRETLRTMSRKRESWGDEETEESAASRSEGIQLVGSHVKKSPTTKSLDADEETQRYMPPELVEMQIQEEKAKKQEAERDRTEPDHAKSDHSEVQPRCMASSSPVATQPEPAKEEALKEKVENVAEEAEKVEAKAKEVESEAEEVKKKAEQMKAEVEGKEERAPSSTESSSSPEDLEKKSPKEEIPSEVTAARANSEEQLDSPASGESYRSDTEESEEESPKQVVSTRMATHQDDNEPKIGKHDSDKIFSKIDSNQTDHFPEDDDDDIEDENHEWILTKRLSKEKMK